MTLSEAQRRRRLIIGLLGLLAGVTLLGAFTSSGGARMGLFAVYLLVDVASSDTCCCWPRLVVWPPNAR